MTVPNCPKCYRMKDDQIASFLCSNLGWRDNVRNAGPCPCPHHINEVSLHESLVIRKARRAA